MSTLESMRTAHPPISPKLARATVASDVTSLQNALQDAAITIRNCCASVRGAIATGSRCARRSTASGSAIPEPLLRDGSPGRARPDVTRIKPGDRVAIAGEDTPEWFYADLGIQMIGAIAVGIYPTNPWVDCNTSFGTAARASS